MRTFFACHLTPERHHREQHQQTGDGGGPTQHRIGVARQLIAHNRIVCGNDHRPKRCGNACQRQHAGNGTDDAIRHTGSEWPAYVEYGKHHHGHYRDACRRRPIHWPPHGGKHQCHHNEHYICQSLYAQHSRALGAMFFHGFAHVNSRFLFSTSLILLNPPTRLTCSKHKRCILKDSAYPACPRYARKISTNQQANQKQGV